MSPAKNLTSPCVSLHPPLCCCSYCLGKKSQWWSASLQASDSRTGSAVYLYVYVYVCVCVRLHACGCVCAARPSISTRISSIFSFHQFSDGSPKYVRNQIGTSGALCGCLAGKAPSTLAGFEAGEPSLNKGQHPCPHTHTPTQTSPQVITIIPLSPDLGAEQGLLELSI